MKTNSMKNKMNNELEKFIFIHHTFPYFYINLNHSCDLLNHKPTSHFECKSPRSSPQAMSTTRNK